MYVCVCKTTKAYNLFDFFFYLWVETTYMFDDLLCGLFLYAGFFLLTVHFEKLCSIGWFHFICSFIRMKDFFLLIPYVRLQWCQSMDVELCSFGFKYWSTQKERQLERDRERAGERKNERKTANNSVHLPDWNQVISSTGVEYSEQRTQTDRQTRIRVAE